MHGGRIFSRIRLHRPKGLNLLPIPLGQAQNVQQEFDTLIYKQGTLSNEPLALAERGPHVAVTMLRYCGGPVPQ